MEDESSAKQMLVSVRAWDGCNTAIAVEGSARLVLTVGGDPEGVQMAIAVAKSDLQRMLMIMLANFKVFNALMCSET